MQGDRECLVTLSLLNATSQRGGSTVTLPVSSL